MKLKLKLGIIFFALFLVVNSFGQDSRLASQYYVDGEFEKAATMFKNLYTKFPTNNYYFEKYVECLQKSDQQDEAEKVIKTAYQQNKDDVSVSLAYAQILENNDRNSEAEKIYSHIIKQTPKNINEVHYLGSRLRNYQKMDLALQVYENGLKTFNNDPDLAYSAALLYKETGNSAKMISSYLDALLSANDRVSIIQSQFQRYLSKDEFEILKGQLYDRVQKDPSTIIYTQMLAWVLLQEKNIGGALRQYIALDRRLNLDGLEVFEMGKMASAEGDYEVAMNAYNYIIENKNKNLGVYHNARNEILEVNKRKLRYQLQVSQEEIEELRKNYEQFFTDFGKNNNTSRVLISYADFEAMIAEDIEKGISLYKELLKIPGLNSYSSANAKIQLGDLYLIYGDIWEATLLYAQVDKEFKDEIIGQEARYRMARLSYFNGEFEWAKEQFDILKASTSRMISNDAIDKVVFINDNLNLDTTAVPMTMFADAEMFVIRRKFSEAISIMDSLLIKFPEHGLADDIFYLKAHIAKEMKDFEMMEGFYLEIINNYPTDIKTDDAIFELAEMYQTILNRPQDALNLYEKLFLEYDNSIFAVESRKRYRFLKEENSPSL